MIYIYLVLLYKYLSGSLFHCSILSALGDKKHIL